MVAADEIAQLLLAVNGNELALVVADESLGHEVAVELCLVACLDLGRCTCLVPETDLVEGAVGVVVVR